MLAIPRAVNLNRKSGAARLRSFLAWVICACMLASAFNRSRKDGLKAGRRIPANGDAPRVYRILKATRFIRACAPGVVQLI
jgi:hypothetical protein